MEAEIIPEPVMHKHLHTSHCNEISSDGTMLSQMYNILVMHKWIT